MSKERKDRAAVFTPRHFLRCAFDLSFLVNTLAHPGQLYDVVVWASSCLLRVPTTLKWSLPAGTGSVHVPVPRHTRLMLLLPADMSALSFRSFDSAHFPPSGKALSF